MAAVVVAGDAADEAGIIRACKVELADFKVSKRVVFVDELPRNTVAKVQKNVLRERYRDLLA